MYRANKLISCLFLLHILFRCDFAGATELTRGPYIQDVTKRSVLIVWETDQAVAGIVRYRVNGRWKVKKDRTETTNHAVRLSRLRAGKRCIYTVRTPGGKLTGSYRFRTAPSAKSDRNLRIAVLGDSGTGDDAQRAVADRLAAWKPQLVLHTGDVVYPNGSQKDYPANFFQPYAALLPTVPFYLSIGNHDTYNGNIEVYLKNFYFPAERSGSFSERYYSFNFGPVHAVALDTEIDFGPDSAQYQWLESDLMQVSSLSRIRWMMVFFHRPPYSSGPHGGNSTVQEHLIPLFENYGVDLVLNGHEHNYERLGPLTADNPNAKPITYIVTGGGGAKLYELTEADPESRVFVSIHHFVGLTVSQNSIAGTAIDSSGVEIDSFLISK